MIRAASVLAKSSMAPSDDLSALAARYFDALMKSDRAALDALLDPEVVFEGFPNRLVPQGERRTKPEMLAAFERGKALLASQRYAIVRTLVEGGSVAVEVTWTATLAAAVGALKPGDTMRAHFAMFLDVRDGRIVRQRNYDCFEPF